MLLRTEKIGHIFSHQLNTLPQLKSTARKLASCIFVFLRLWGPEWINPCPTRGSHLLCTVTAGCHMSWARFSELSPRSPAPYTWSTFYLRGAAMRKRDSLWGSWGRAHRRSQTRANWKMSSRAPTLAMKSPLREDPLLPFPCQRQHRNYPKRGRGGGNKRKNKTQRTKPRTQGLQHLWRWWADGREQRGSVFLVTAPGWLRWSQTHPLLQKALTYCLFINPTAGFHAWESLLQI